MVYWIVLHFLQFLFDVLTVSHLSEREKDVQILLLRQQLRIAERKQQRAPRLLRWQKLILALLAGWLQRRGKAGRTKLKSVALISADVTQVASGSSSAQMDVQAEGQVGRPRTQHRKRCCAWLRGDPDWGYSRLEDELSKLGFDIGETTIRDMFKRRTTAGSRTLTQEVRGARS
jgi:hypothetical protein